MSKWEGVTNSSNNIFTLCTWQIITVSTRCAATGVTGKTYAGARCLTNISKDHRLHVDGGTKVCANSFATTIELRTFGVP